MSSPKIHEQNKSHESYKGEKVDTTFSLVNFSIIRIMLGAVVDLVHDVNETLTPVVDCVIDTLSRLGDEPVIRATMHNIPVTVNLITAKRVSTNSLTVGHGGWFGVVTKFKLFRPFGLIRQDIHLATVGRVHTPFPLGF